MAGPSSSAARSGGSAASGPPDAAGAGGEDDVGGGAGFARDLFGGKTGRAYQLGGEGPAGANSEFLGFP